MSATLIFAVGFLAGSGFMWILWRTVLLPHAVMEMRDMGLIRYNDDVIKAYRIDSYSEGNL